MSRPTIQWTYFRVPKKGNVPEECEDAVAGDPDRGRFAIADGASESFAAGEWAKLLVSHFVRDSSSKWMADARSQWDSSVGNSAQSWYAEEKLSAGAHATFVGLTLVNEGSQCRWFSQAYGDSCLIHSRGASLLLSFPIEQSSDFSSSPLLVRSRGVTPAWKEQQGELAVGETLYLATDALAQYLLASAEAGEFNGRFFAGLNDDEFWNWVMEARSAGKLHNDDVALAIVERVA